MRPYGTSMLIQYHDHYNSHCDGSDADTVTYTAAERQQLDIDELSESGGLRNSLIYPVCVLCTMSYRFYHAMHINKFFSKKTMGGQTIRWGVWSDGSAVWPVFREMASSRWRDRPPNLASMVSRCLSIAQKVTFLWSSLKCIILLCVPLLILC